MSAKVKVWDDPEYRKKYFQQYYLQHREEPPREQKNPRGWSIDPELKKKYHQEYNRTKRREPVECPVCKLSIPKTNWNYHLKSKFHLNAVKIFNFQ